MKLKYCLRRMVVISLGLLNAPSLYGFLFTLAAPGIASTYVQTGPGGGGRISSFIISPHTNNIILAANDMGGVMRSIDSGSSWTLLHADDILYLNVDSLSEDRENTLRTNPFSWSFTQPGLVMAGGWYGFYKSIDSGETWAEITGPWNNTNTPRVGPDFVCFKASGDLSMALFNHYTNESQRAMFLSWNNGTTWWERTINFTNHIVGGLIDDYAGSCRYVIATEDGIYYSENDGTTWQARNNGLPLSGRKISGFTGASVPNVGKAMYLTLETEQSGQTIADCVYVSTNSGQSWTSCMNGLFTDIRDGTIPFYQEIAVSAFNPQTACVCYEGGQRNGVPTAPHYGDGGLFLTTDGGTSWTEIFFQQETHPDFNFDNINWITQNTWPWAQKPDQVYIHAYDEKCILTGSTGLQISTNSGTSWLDIAAQSESATGSPGPGSAPVLNITGHFVHPADSNFRYFTSMDFMTFYSTDQGYHWQLGGPMNNSYDIAMVPALINGMPEIWVSGGFLHDIPDFKYTGLNLTNFHGGVCYTTNNFETYTLVQGTNGLPDSVVTGIWLDPNSPAGNRTLWTAVFGYGFYKSTDHGITWVQKNNGINIQGAQINAYKVGKDPHGRMYALVTTKAGWRGGLYFSWNDGETWFEQTEWADHILYPLDVAFNPTNSAIIYLAGETAPSTPQYPGGLWESKDWGASWTKIFDHACNSIAVDPSAPSNLYITVSKGWRDQTDFGVFGLWKSQNGGLSFTRDTNFPSCKPRNVNIAPSGTVYISTAGTGLWEKQ